ncbi:hypothetical protein A2856_00730 [Candidatus Uhrbacteria bacterium RIFCSPHIGHO2_01_FULL_63_20]|uniref:Uncharacterized protein n=1 Tax=Candidatus Uhrbacteria bacterium RIFCSPHIGHO2_01_FULL_63_20 TaxID=1802385 RepID=A0A1F7TLZ8_9BACT|nr:MAG: hypothetical protein A2856_00730 [Candidatus Uhrbacteria bacterium RIFCSPHIGHO2_01_FULL_63_20]
MPVAVLLLPYLLFLLLYAVYGGFVLYHLTRFGIAGKGLYLTAGGFVIGTTILLLVSAVGLGSFDWSVPMSVDFLNLPSTSAFPSAL